MPSKDWVTVRFSSTGQVWIPSFADLHRIIVAIAEVEEDKYPPAQGKRGGSFVYDFLRASLQSFATGRRYSDLAADFSIPDRSTEAVSARKFSIEIGPVSFLGPDAQEADADVRRRSA